MIEISNPQENEFQLTKSIFIQELLESEKVLRYCFVKVSRISIEFIAIERLCYVIFLIASFPIMSIIHSLNFFRLLGEQPTLVHLNLFYLIWYFLVTSGENARWLFNRLTSILEPYTYIPQCNQTMKLSTTLSSSISMNNKVAHHVFGQPMYCANRSHT